MPKNCKAFLTPSDSHERHALSVPISSSKTNHLVFKFFIKILRMNESFSFRVWEWEMAQMRESHAESVRHETYVSALCDRIFIWQAFELVKYSPVWSLPKKTALYSISWGIFRPMTKVKSWQFSIRHFTYQDQEWLQLLPRLLFASRSLWTALLDSS